MAELYVLGQNSQAQACVDLYNEQKRIRLPLEPDWRNVARFGLPRQYGGWAVSNAAPTAAGAGAARQARIDSFDSTLARSINIYAAVEERMLTPGTQRYHVLQAVDEKVQRSRAAQLYFERLNNALFSRRYDPYANFVATQGEVYISGGAYGNAAKLITWRSADKRFGRPAGFAYRNIPFRNMHWWEDANGNICGWARRIDWTVDQAMRELKDNCPAKIQDAAKQPNRDRTRTYEFFQMVMSAEDYEEGAIDRRRYPLVSLYVFVEDPCICVKPAGYRSNPLVTPRHFGTDGVPYGYGPAQSVLSSVGSANAQVRTMLRYGQRAAEPVLFTHNDGIMNGQVDLTPGYTNPGGVNSQGQLLVKSLELGNLQVNDKMLEMTRDDVRDPLFGKIFEILKDRPQMTATEVLDIAGREAALIAPIMGRMQSEDLARTIEREISLLAENNAMPEDMPKEIVDAEYRPIYTSPLARAMHSEDVSGYMRTVDMAINVVKLTGKTTLLNYFNFDVSLPAIAAQQGAPPSWMNDQAKVQQLAAQDQQQQQQQQTVDALPAAASVMKTMSDNNMKPAPAQ